MPQLDSSDCGLDEPQWLKNQQQMLGPGYSQAKYLTDWHATNELLHQKPQDYLQQQQSSTALQYLQNLHPQLQSFEGHYEQCSKCEELHLFPKPEDRIRHDEHCVGPKMITCPICDDEVKERSLSAYKVVLERIVLNDGSKETWDTLRVCPNCYSVLASKPVPALPKPWLSRIQVWHLLFAALLIVLVGSVATSLFDVTIAVIMWLGQLPAWTLIFPAVIAFCFVIPVWLDS
jgi:hypothetical protein